MFHPRPVPATRPARSAQSHPRRHSLLLSLAVLALLGVVAPSQAQLLSASGRWTPTSQTRNCFSEDNTAIHMALLRGDDDWQSIPGHYHSYLFWWENRHDLCGSPTKFSGALYGWNPGANTNCTTDMMSSGFTVLPLNSVLDPGYDVFCAGHTTIGDGRLMVVGGSSAENSGVQWTSVFDRKITTGSRWTSMGQMALPRWYPTVKQLSNNQVVAYAGLRYARMHVLGGRASVGGTLRTTVARQRLTDTGEWDADALPAVDPGVTVGENQPGPREYATAPIIKANTGLSRTFLFGGKDGSGSSNAVRSDVWWLLHKTDGGGDQLEWFKFTTVTGIAPAAGLWKHVAVVDTATTGGDLWSRLWVYGGLDKFGSPNTSVYRGVQSALDSTGRTWNWTLLPLPGGPGARSQASCAFDIKYNRMIVYGGYDASGAVANNEVYALKLDTANPTWEQLTWDNSVSSQRPGSLAEAALCAGPTDAEHLDGPSANMYLYGGVDAGGALHGDVWLTYFPDSHSVSWHKLNIKATTRIPNPRRGPIVVRDHDSWNLRIFGGANAAGQTPDTTWMIDVYRNPSVPDCDNREREWGFQESHTGGGAIGAVGFPDPFEVPANTVERRTPDDPPGNWSNIPNSPDRYQHFYPLLFALPNGKLFDVSANTWFKPTYVLDFATGAWAQFPTGETPSSLQPLEGGSAVSRVLLDRTYEVMKCGTKDLQGGSAIGLTARIQIAPDGTTSGWTPAGTMLKRVFHNLVSLPNGKVFVTGGANAVDYGLSSTSPQMVHRPQIWDPLTGTWSDTTLARENTARGYHSTALLMPDGRVLTGGGNDEASALEKHKFGVYCPPYMFSGNTPANIPVISAGPRTLEYNASFFVQTMAMVDKLCLIRPGAVTHGFNPDQHYIELNFTRCQYGVYAEAPTAAYAPPGDYLLFVVNSAGVPSVGRWLRLGNEATITDAIYDYSSCTGGGSGGGEGGGGGYYDDGLTVRQAGGSALAAGEISNPSSQYADNTLFAGSADGAVVRDRLPLPRGPVRTATGLRARLLHKGSGNDEYERVRLVALDHELGSDVATDSTGESAGVRGSALSLTMANGRNAMEDMAANGCADGQSGDEMVAVLGDGGEGAVWLETSGHVLDEGGIRVEAEQAGEWVEAGVVTPRATPTRTLVTGVSGQRVKLVFLGAHRVHGLGWFHPATSAHSRTELAPVAIHHSRSGDLAADAAIELENADTAYVDFPYLAEAAGVTRDWFLEVDGRPVGYKPSATQLSARHLGRSPDRPVASPPLAFRFLGNVPNPFSASTRLSFELPTSSDVRVEVFDSQGRRVRRMDRHFEAGRQFVDWNRRTERGVLAAPGVYQVRLIAGEHTATRPVVVLP